VGSLGLVALVVLLILNALGVFTPASISVQPLLKLPATSAVAVGLGEGWLANDNNNTVVEFNPSTGAHLAQPIAVKGRPATITTAFGHVWVGSFVSDTVEEIDPSTHRVVRDIKVAAGPSGFAVLDGELWVASVIDNTLSAINPTTGRVVITQHLPTGAVRVAAGFGRLWVSGTSRELVAVSPRRAGGSLPSTKIKIGLIPLAVAVGNGSVWVANSSSNSVSQIDPRTDTVIHTYKGVENPIAVVVTGSQTWVAEGPHDLRVLGSSLKPVALAGAPRDIVALGNTVFVAEGNPGGIQTASVKN
jgi:YVTN family beta-propeller protein